MCTLPAVNEGAEALKPLHIPLEYATGQRRRSAGRWRSAARGLVRYGVIALVVSLPVAVVYVSHRWPWVWYGSTGNFELHRMRTFSMPADRVVYEEDPVRADALLVSPPDPAGRDIDRPDGATDSDYRRRNGSATEVWYSPPFVRPQIWIPGDGALVFMHARTAPTGVRRAVWVQASGSRRASSPPGVGLAVYWHEADWPFFRSDSAHRCMFRNMRIPTGPGAKVRLFAGQPDADDPARFAIRYEIDDVPGTIEGRLGADDTVTFRVLDGPAATTQPVQNWGPGHAN